MTENVQKDELAEAVREAIGTLREISRGSRGVVSVTERIAASDKLIQIASDYPEAFEAFDDNDEGKCDTCESLRDELEAAREESDRQFARADSAEKALAPLRERITVLEFGAKESQEAVDDAFEAVHRWLDELEAPRTKVETDEGDEAALSLKERVEWIGAELARGNAYVERQVRADRFCSEAVDIGPLRTENLRLKRKLAKARERRDFYNTALTAVLRHEGAPPGGVNAFVDAIKGREARIAGLLEKLDKIGVEFASKEAAITALVSEREAAIAALEAANMCSAPTIEARIRKLSEGRDTARLELDYAKRAIDGFRMEIDEANTMLDKEGVEREGFMIARKDGDESMRIRIADRIRHMVGKTSGQLAIGEANKDIVSMLEKERDGLRAEIASLTEAAAEKEKLLQRANARLDEAQRRGDAHLAAYADIVRAFNEAGFNCDVTNVKSVVATAETISKVAMKEFTSYPPHEPPHPNVADAHKLMYCGQFRRRVSGDADSYMASAWFMHGDGIYTTSNVGAGLTTRRWSFEDFLHNFSPAT